MKNRHEAEEYLKKALKTDKPVADDKALKDIKFKKITVNHVETANTLAKLACVVPMPKLSREIILYKLANPGISNMQIALMAGIRMDDVITYEFDGKQRMMAYLDKHSEQDVINKFNADSVIEKEVRNIKAKKAPGGGNKLD